MLASSCSLNYPSNSLKKSPSWELIVAPLIKKFPLIYGTRRAITVFRSDHHWTLSEPEECSPHTSQVIGCKVLIPSLQTPIHLQARYLASINILQKYSNYQESETFRTHISSIKFSRNLFLRPWMRRYIPTKRRWTLNRVHGVISQKMILFSYNTRP
jgi:hypothetical protein